MAKTNNRRINNFVIKIDLYDYNVMVSLGETTDELKNNLYKKLGIDSDPDILNLGKSSGRCIEFPKSWDFLIIVKSHPENSRHWAIIQHEIFHVAAALMRRLGIKLCKKSEEAYAYLIDHITEKIYEKL